MRRWAALNVPIWLVVCCEANFSSSITALLLQVLFSEPPCELELGLAPGEQQHEGSWDQLGNQALTPEC